MIASKLLEEYKIFNTFFFYFNPIMGLPLQSMLDNFPSNDFTLEEKIYFMKWASWRNELNVFSYYAKDVDLEMDSNVFFKYAVCNGSIDIVRFLIESGVDITFDNNYAIKASVFFPNILQYLIDQGANFHVNDEFPLRYAVYSDKIFSVILLVENGADIYAKDNDVIKIAVEKQSLDIIKYFIECGMNVSIENDLIFKKLWNISYMREYLLELGANPNRLDSNDYWNILVNDNAIEIIQLLIKYGLDMNLVNSKISISNSPKTELVNLLLENGMEMNTLLSILLN